MLWRSELVLDLKKFFSCFPGEKFFCASLNIHPNQSICANEKRRSLHVSLDFAGFCAEMCDDVRSGDRSESKRHLTESKTIMK